MEETKRSAAKSATEEQSAVSGSDMDISQSDTSDFGSAIGGSTKGVKADGGSRDNPGTCMAEQSKRTKRTKSRMGSLRAGSEKESEKDDSDGSAAGKRSIEAAPRPPTLIHGTMDVPVQVLNSHLVCGLCHGYFRDPYTITECLHAFCKSCLFYAFFTGFRRCPTCLKSLEPDPYKEVLSDRSLHELVQKIFPTLQDDDDVEEEKFYRRRGIKRKALVGVEKDELKEEEKKIADGTETKASSGIGGTRAAGAGGKNQPVSGRASRRACKASIPHTAQPLGEKTRTNNDGERENGEIPPDEMDFVLEPNADVERRYRMPRLRNPLLRTSGRLKVVKLKKYLLEKLDITSNPNMVEILCNGDPLGDELSLTFIKRTRWLESSEDLKLTFRFSEEFIY